MKSRTIVLVTGLVFVGSIATKALSDESSDNMDLTKEVQRLRTEVRALRRQVENLKMVFDYDDDDIQALKQRAEQAEEMQSLIETIYRSEDPARFKVATQLHQVTAALHHAHARLSFALKEHDAAIEHMDAAISAWRKLQAVFEKRREVGSVSISLWMSAQQSVTDARLEKNRMRRTIHFLHAEKPSDVNGTVPDE